MDPHREDHPAEGACNATSKHSRMSSSDTGRVRSSRLRTERVVVSSSSGVKGSVGMRFMIAAQVCEVSKLVQYRNVVI